MTWVVMVFFHSLNKTIEVPPTFVQNLLGLINFDIKNAFLISLVTLIKIN